MLSRHAPGDKVRYSEIFPALRARDISVERVAEVLQEMGVLIDDRRPSFERWLERKLDGLAAGIRQDVEAWLRTMRDGGPRTKPRDIASVWNLMNHLRPTLTGWSDRYDHLREVTRDDVIAILGELHGSRRSNVLVALRSLFAFCKKQGTIFRNPARGIKVGQHPYGIAQRLGQDDVDQAAGAAATPSARLVLVLAAVHAARTGAIRAAQLDDVDLGNRRLIIAGRVRPIDEFTHQILLDWLGCRRTRWPDTANPHLLINQHSAMGTGPVSTIYFAQTKLRGQAARCLGDMRCARDAPPEYRPLTSHDEPSPLPQSEPSKLPPACAAHETANSEVVPYCLVAALNFTTSSAGTRSPGAHARLGRGDRRRYSPGRREPAQLRLLLG